MPDAQSVSTEHVVAHAPAEQVKPLVQARVPCGAPVPMLVHVPTEPVTSHAEQVAAHAVEQHTPSTHSPDAQSVAAVQATPLPSLATHWPVVVEQRLVVGSHAVSDVHAVAHEPFEQTYGAVQLPRPLAGGPSTGEQVPTLPATLHAEQVPGHALSQQTPSTQKLLVHSSAAAHAAPLVFFATQTPVLQYAVVLAHAVSAVHEVAQVPAAVHWTKVPHEGREPCGAASTTAMQMPTRPVVSHAWHWPAQA